MIGVFAVDEIKVMKLHFFVANLLNENLEGKDPFYDFLSSGTMALCLMALSLMTLGIRTIIIVTLRKCLSVILL